MIKIKQGHYYGQNQSDNAREKTMAYKILSAHNQSGDMTKLKLRFDAMASHDITYVNIVQTARASGMTRFPLPYVLTNCHNSLCAVGGTINEDDHEFGLSAAKRYGGIFVPAHLAVIHQYMRENFFGSGMMILGSDSHTRLGAMGTMAIGEGGPELVLQLLEKTYDITYPKIAGVYLHGEPQPGVGPHDVALAIIAATYKDGIVNNAVMEFVGPGIAGLSMDFRNGIDVMTTETTCLSSIWQTDERTLEYAKIHGKPDACVMQSPEDGAYYDTWIDVDLSMIKPMIALPFHPSNAFPIEDVAKNPGDYLQKALGNGNFEKLLVGGRLRADQAVIAGCAGGTFENVIRAAQIMKSADGYSQTPLSVYPSSQPVYLELVRKGVIASLMESGAVIRSAFCGPCFGAGDVPANGAFSIRHTTRNFPNREGSRPGDGQSAYVALMDARSIAATVRNGGLLTAATELDISYDALPEYNYDDAPYRKRVWSGTANSDEQLKFGPNISDWPKFQRLPENLLLKVASALYDEVTTTDELIPSGETSSLRSNPVKLSSFALSRRDPGYVGRAGDIAALDNRRLANNIAGNSMHNYTDDSTDDNTGNIDGELKAILELTGRPAVEAAEDTGIGSVLFALKPGDGSAREQAASCQRVLGGSANIAAEYATKRYRSNVINWGMLPFILDGAKEYNIAVGDVIYLPGIREAVGGGAESVDAKLFRQGKSGCENIALRLPGLTRLERDIIIAGCLINYYAKS